MSRGPNADPRSSAGGTSRSRGGSPSPGSRSGRRRSELRWASANRRGTKTTRVFLRARVSAGPPAGIRVQGLDFAQGGDERLEPVGTQLARNLYLRALPVRQGRAERLLAGSGQRHLARARIAPRDDRNEAALEERIESARKRGAVEQE